MKVYYHLDENEKSTNIGVAKALTEVHRLSDLREIVGYLLVYINSDHSTKGGE